MNVAPRITQIEGVTATQLFDALKCLENQIRELRDAQPKTENGTRYLTRDELRDLLKVSYPTITDWQKRGLIQGYRMGQKVYFKQNEVDAAMVALPTRKGGARP